jgi:hypothetical protein
MAKLSHAQFNAVLNNIKVHVKENVVLSIWVTSGEPKDTEVAATFSYSEGLQEYLGYELVAFGHACPDELAASAMLLYHDFPAAMTLDVSNDILQKAIPDRLVNVQYKQAVVDNSKLDEELSVDPRDKVSSEWVADGGYPLVTQQEFLEQIASFESTPDQTQDAMNSVREDLREKIKQYGYAVVAFPGDNEVPCAYTVGLTYKGLPELIISGRLEITDLSDFLGEFTQRLIDGGYGLYRIENAFNVTQDLDGNSRDEPFDIRMVEVDPTNAAEKFLIQAGPILKQPVTRVAWLQISDLQKRFFGEEGFINTFNQADIGPIIAT